METKIISVVGEKGGIGKTTLNIILASDLFYAKGKKVVLLDLDNPQYSIYNKRQRELESLDEEERQSIELYPIEPVTVPYRIPLSSTTGWWIILYLIFPEA